MGIMGIKGITGPYNKRDADIKNDDIYTYTSMRTHIGAG